MQLQLIKATSFIYLLLQINPVIIKIINFKIENVFQKLIPALIKETRKYRKISQFLIYYTNNKNAIKLLPKIRAKTKGLVESET